MDNKQPTKYRLGVLAICLLVIAAVVADLISLIPVAGDIVGPLFWILASIFLYTKGFGLTNAGRLATSLISMVGEMVPIVQELPLITAGIIVIIVMSRIEDKTGIKIPGAGTSPSLNQGGVRAPMPTQAPQLNVDGVRQPSIPNIPERE